MSHADTERNPQLLTEFIALCLENVNQLRGLMDLEMEPVMEPKIDSALKIIANITVIADNVYLIENQCKRLAERFRDIGKALEVKKTDNIRDAVFTTSAIDQILMVLEKGQALVQSYAQQSSALQNVVNRADNYDAFKEVHEEIDALGTYLDLGQTEKTDLLISDAENDRKGIVDRIVKLILDDTPKDSAGSVADSDGKDEAENMKKAVAEKCYGLSAEDDLSYLNIPISAILLDGAIKDLPPLEKRRSQRDAHLDGRALVYKGRWNGCECAIKVFMYRDVQWNTEELRKEIASLVKLRHPHVTLLIGRAQHENKTYVLYEKMDCDLRELIDSRMKKKVWPKFFQDRPFSRTKEVSIITQIARGMFYLHEKGLVHGELKCTNLLVKQLGNNIDVKVADFHCSRELGKTPTGKYKPAHRPRWMPPEAFEHYNVDQPSDDLLMKGDVYSFAMTCYEVVTGKYPFDGIKGEAVDEKIKAGERPELPEDLSKDLKNLITKCWHQDPEQRPRFQEICHVLTVNAVNIVSHVERLPMFTGCVRIANQEPVGVEPDEIKNWSDYFREQNKTEMTSSTTIDDAAKDLPHYLKITSSHLQPLRRLGNGASAVVFEASWVGCRFAVKWLKVDHVAKLRNEVRIMMQLLHPHVIRLVGFSVLENRCAIVMELMDTSLEELIRSRIMKHATPFSEAEALAIIRKLALGMDFLHSRGVTHGDLKPANVLVRNEHLKSGMDVKIVDFGLSQMLGESAPKTVPVLGRYRAPEIILSMEANAEHVDIDRKAADVYSFALMCLPIITGKQPFSEHKSDSTAEAVAKGGGTPKLGNYIQVRDDLRQLLEKCWSREHQARPKFCEIVEKFDRMCRP